MFKDFNIRAALRDIKKKGSAYWNQAFIRVWIGVPKIESETLIWMPWPNYYAVSQKNANNNCRLLWEFQ